MAEHQVYDCPENELGLLLHDFFKDPDIDEVIVDHPVDGPKVISREYYMELISAAAEKTHTEQEARQMREAFIMKLVFAEVRVIDVSEDNNFGTDTSGRKIENIGGMILIPSAQYPDGCDLLEKEVGCFYDEDGQRETIRLVTE